LNLTLQIGVVAALQCKERSSLVRLSLEDLIVKPSDPLPAFGVHAVRRASLAFFSPQP